MELKTPNTAPSYFVSQDWLNRYTQTDHSVWATLLKSAKKLSLRKSCSLYLKGSELIEFEPHQIAKFDELSARLLKINGWEVIPVNGYLPDELFFQYISNKKFPTSCEIRSLDESSFQEYPDLFHDIYGHVPLLIYPAVTDLLLSCATGILKALKLGRKDLAKRISALYWFTIEVGLILESGDLRVYGGAITSSEKETFFATLDKAPNLIHFNLSRVMRTEYNMLDLQETYFVIDSFDQLKRIARQDLFNVALSLEHLASIKQGELCDDDEIIQEGTGEYHASEVASALT